MSRYADELGLFVLKLKGSLEKREDEKEMLLICIDFTDMRYLIILSKSHMEFLRKFANQGRKGAIIEHAPIAICSSRLSPHPTPV